MDEYPVTINARAVTIDKIGDEFVLCIHTGDAEAVFYKGGDPDRIERDLADHGYIGAVNGDE